MSLAEKFSKITVYEDKKCSELFILLLKNKETNYGKSLFLITVNEPNKKQPYKVY